MYLPPLIILLLFRNLEGDFELENIPYDVILVLRLLLLRDTDTQAWRTFTSLASLLEEWKKMDPWEENQEGIVRFIRQDLGLTEFSREEILTVSLYVGAVICYI